MHIGAIFDLSQLIFLFLLVLLLVIYNPKLNYPHPRITGCRAIPIMLFPCCKESCSRMRFCQESCSRMRSGFCETFAIRIVARNVQQPFGPYIGHAKPNPGSGFRHVYRRPPTNSSCMDSSHSIKSGYSPFQHFWHFSSLISNPLVCKTLKS